MSAQFRDPLLPKRYDLSGPNRQSPTGEGFSRALKQTHPRTEPDPHTPIRNVIETERTPDPAIQSAHGDHGWAALEGFVRLETDRVDWRVFREGDG
jgi:hypothetical protein